MCIIFPKKQKKKSRDINSVQDEFAAETDRWIKMRRIDAEDKDSSSFPAM